VPALMRSIEVANNCIEHDRNSFPKPVSVVLNSN
jgi:hypothetical protein